MTSCSLDSAKSCIGIVIVSSPSRAILQSHQPCLERRADSTRQPVSGIFSIAVTYRDHPRPWKRGHRAPAAARSARRRWCSSPARPCMT
ncbi:predicted protein [Coccidioides posadasii str. Silveira]|uniref:Predicted protein n=1 Tax=Coccidioides posadasii (strain RMSCC 757 / Silveira) TaxID=443226 RepID=E9DGU3_COCPS|nr:predicted protein [Coccidioides posadasii str. Silveira]